VSDKSTQQPIEAATVIVDGTSYGILTKANGTYTILGVPPGTYNLTAKRVGYEGVTAQNVVVRADISRTQDFELSSARLLGTLQIQAPPVPLAATAASAGPGSAFGIDAYDCASCGVARYRDSVHAVYTFGAEPVVVTVSPLARDRIRPGDVIVAVNGNPITTRAGADMFAYPDSGEIKLTLRRNGTNIDVFSYSLNSVRASVQPVRAQGGRGGAGGFSGSGGVGGGGGGRGRGVAVGAAPARANLVTADSVLRDRLARCAVAPRSTGDSVRLQVQRAPCVADTLNAIARANQPADPTRAAGRGGAGAAQGGIARAGGGRGGAFGAVAAPSGAEMVSSIVELRNFGFTLSCRPDCTRMRSTTGALYWKFDGYPTVAVMSLVKGGVAEKAGIREGDVLISVNALSPLTEEGAVLLNRTDRELELTLEFSRGGKREKYVLKL
jgi:membrane-associated protease RseP (regulator of RpoE activity)